jgi:hypothetical protein
VDTLADSATSEALRQDLFPVEVVVNGDLIAKQARVFITSEAAHVYVAQADRSVTPLGSFLLDEDPVLYRATSFIGSRTFHTDAGPMIVTRGKGCGCHSPLKTMTSPVAW